MEPSRRNTIFAGVSEDAVVAVGTVCAWWWRVTVEWCGQWWHGSDVGVAWWGESGWYGGQCG